MNLDEYRAAVRTVACPLEACGASPGEHCWEPGEVRQAANDGPVSYVHDDRSLAWHEAMFHLVLQRLTGTAPITELRDQYADLHPHRADAIRASLGPDSDTGEVLCRCVGLNHRDDCPNHVVPL